MVINDLVGFMLSSRGMNDFKSGLMTYGNL